MTDIYLSPDGVTTLVTGNTDEGELFVDSWIKGVLSVEDSGRMTLTSEAVEEMTRAAQEQGLTVAIDG